MPLNSKAFDRWREENADRLTPGDSGRNPLGASRPTRLHPPRPGRSRPDEELARYDAKLGLPGQPPFTRGIRPGMYREGNWVMGMYSGQGSPDRDQPADPLPARRRPNRVLAGARPPHPVGPGLRSSPGPRRGGTGGRAHRQPGRHGGAVDGVSLDKVSQIRTTANSIGPLAVALFVAGAEVHGVLARRLQGDAAERRPEGVRRPPHRTSSPTGPGATSPSTSSSTAPRPLPHWEPIEFCGYHIRDSGSTAVQEVAIAISNGIEYIECAPRPRAPHRVVRPLGVHVPVLRPRHLRRGGQVPCAAGCGPTSCERFGATDDASRALNIFCYTLGGYQTANEPLEQPDPDLVPGRWPRCWAASRPWPPRRSTRRCGIPSQEAAHLGLRTQQILALETGVTRSADPLGGLVPGRGPDRPAGGGDPRPTWPASSEKVGPSAHSSPGSWRPR